MSRQQQRVVTTAVLSLALLGSGVALAPAEAEAKVKRTTVTEPRECSTPAAERAAAGSALSQRCAGTPVTVPQPPTTASATLAPGESVTLSVICPADATTTITPESGVLVSGKGSIDNGDATITVTRTITAEVATTVTLTCITA